MRKIQLKKLGKEGENGVLDYTVMIKNMLQFPQSGQQGFGVDEIRSNIKILDALEKSEKELLIEEADYIRLKNLVDGAKYGMAHKNIIQFVDDVDHAEAVKVEEKKNE